MYVSRFVSRIPLSPFADIIFRRYRFSQSNLLPLNCDAIDLPKFQRGGEGSCLIFIFSNTVETMTTTQLKCTQGGVKQMIHLPPQKYSLTGIRMQATNNIIRVNYTNLIEEITRPLSEDFYKVRWKDSLLVINPALPPRKQALISL